MAEVLCWVAPWRRSGVLTRVSGMFARRGFNIDSLTVGETADPTISRMTIVASGDSWVIDQIKKQLSKLIDVIEIVELEAEQAVFRELVLVKINAPASERANILSTINVFRAKVVDIGEDTIMAEITGDRTKVRAFTDMMSNYGIQEIVRTGLTALERRKNGFVESKHFEEE